ncbi:ABC transporter substrate-binding protein [Actinacidiphila sp. ITFR-21]|uniref:ABC transporter substrate-binding protein n=1 Tax=Actinacidiphila sp. ITFR-21 TaxID=3075199 RepID=UPI002889C05B|nr:ABC transporter substrate-binding protein [Streptomyces sp. ITFR-21]WNI19001.1 ABC transporter substrate-binding protein [Streptomyces sp. ITFR-21]
MNTTMRGRVGPRSRRSRLMYTVAAPALALVVLTACGGSGSGSGSGSASSSGSGGGSGTIPLGLVAPRSGSLAEFGTNLDQGAQIAVDEINAKGGVLGKKLSIDWRDDQSTAPGMTSAVRSLASAGHKLMFGFTNSAACLSALPIADSLGASMVGVCAAAGLTGPDRVAKNYYNISNTTHAYAVAEAQVIAKKVPTASDWYEFGFDYVTGHDEADSFFGELKAQGQQFTLKGSTYVPLLQQDYTTQVNALAQKLTPAGADHRALFLGTYGAGTIAFMQEARQVGLLKDFSTIVTGGNYWSSATTLKENAPQAWNAYDFYYDMPGNTPAAATFVASFQAKFHKLPFSWNSEGYQSVYAYASAIKAAGSADAAKVTAALADVKVDGLTGTYGFDPTTHTPNQAIAVTLTGGDKSAPEGVKLLDSALVPAATYNDPKAKL